MHDKKIKKHIYGKKQAVNVLFPAGLGARALNEVETLLKHPWFSKPFTGRCTLANQVIRIDDIHMTAIVELLMRATCISDIRLILYKGQASGKKAFEKKCLGIPWEYYINEQCILKLKVNSIASHAFHESALKQILSDILTPYTPHIVRGEAVDFTTCVYAELYKDYLTVSVSLAGEPLYKRGFRTELSQSAPLREDIAACCIQNALEFSQVVPDSVLIPFSGTGTFAFEYIAAMQSYAPVLCGRTYALQKMPLFRAETFQFLLKKARAAHHPHTPLPIVCLDRSKEANNVLIQNKNALPEIAAFSDITVLHADFFTLDWLTLNKRLPGKLFIPLNPPYGIRLNKTTDPAHLYKKIALKLNTLITNRTDDVTGLILCPTESAWSNFCKTLLHTKLETYHITQGGLDIRICQWVSSARL